MRSVLAAFCAAAVLMTLLTDADAASHARKPVKKDEAKVQIFAPKGGGVFYSFIVPADWKKNHHFQNWLKANVAMRLKKDAHKKAG